MTDDWDASGTAGDKSPAAKTASAIIIRCLIQQGPLESACLDETHFGKCEFCETNSSHIFTFPLAVVRERHNLPFLHYMTF